MASVTVTFTFDTTPQGFAQNPGTSVIMTGNTGSLVSSRAVKGATGADSSWTQTITYIALGVPAGAIVRSITAGSMASQATTFTSAGSGNTSGAVTLQDGATIATLSAQRPITDTTLATTNGVDLTGLSKAASNQVVITIPNHLQNANTSGSTVTLSQDTLTFVLTYDFPYFASIDDYPQPPALRQSINRAAATMLGDPGIVAPKPLPLYQDTQAWPQPPVASKRINRAAGFMPINPGIEAPYVFVPPPPPTNYALDQPAPLPARRPGSRYAPTRLSVVAAYLPGSVSWKAILPELPQRRPAYGYQPTRLSIMADDQIPPTPAPLGDWVDTQTPPLLPKKPFHNYTPTRLSLALSNAGSARQEFLADQFQVVRFPRRSVEALALSIALPQFGEFVPLTWERDTNFVKPKKYYQPTDGRGVGDWVIDEPLIPEPPVGIDGIDTVRRPLLSKRGAVLTHTGINPYLPSLLGWGFDPALPLTAQPKRRPIEPPQYGPLLDRISLEWGFQQYEAWPPRSVLSRHAYTHQVILNDLFVYTAFPPLGWEPVSGLLASRSPVYRGAALHRDFNIDALFVERRDVGWQVQPPILPHIRYKLRDYAWPAGEPPYVGPKWEWGFEPQYATPLKASYQRHPHAEMVWRADPTVLVPLVPLEVGADQTQGPLQVPALRSRAAALLPFQSEAKVFAPALVGFEAIYEESVNRRRLFAKDWIGVGEVALYPPVALEWGFEQFDARPLLPVVRRHGYSEIVWRADPEILVPPPAAAQEWGFQPVPAQPLRNFYNRRAALVRGFDIEGPFPFNNLFGWPVQPWQPPPQNRHRQSALFAGVNPPGATSFFLPHGWQTQPWQPPIWRQFHRGAALPFWTGDVGKYVPPIPVALEWLAPYAHQTLRPRAGGKRQILVMGGDASGIFGPTPDSRHPQSGFIVNMGRWGRGTR